MLQISLISGIYKNTEGKMRDISTRKFLLPNFTKKWRFDEQGGGGWYCLFKSICGPHSELHMWHITRYFIFFAYFHEIKYVYYTYTTETSSLFTLECKEHASLDESSGGGKCK